VFILFLSFTIIGTHSLSVDIKYRMKLRILTLEGRGIATEASFGMKLSPDAVRFP
jgi:hypothetical protein